LKKLVFNLKWNRKKKGSCIFSDPALPASEVANGCLSSFMYTNLK